MNKEPKDCIKQIINDETPSDWDQIDTMSFNFDQVKVKDEPYNSINVDFENGLVTCYDADGEPIKKFAIEIILHEIK